MKSDLNLLQSMTTLVVDVTSRHNIVDDHDVAFDVLHVMPSDVASTSSTLLTLLTLHHVNFFDVVDTSSRHEHLPEIKIRLWKASEFTILIFEITFFLKTDKLKSAFKLRLTSPGRKL